MFPISSVDVYLLTLPRVANCLDIVAVGIEDKGSIVTWMVVRAYPGRSIINAAGRDSFIMKSVYGCSILRREGDMSPGLRGVPPSDPEEGFGTDAIACELVTFRM